MGQAGRIVNYMWLPSPVRLVVRVAQRFQRESLAQTAAALSFTTVLALVPMIAVAAALLSWLPFGTGFENAMRAFLLDNLLPDKAGDVIAKYIGLFAHRVNRITVWGAVLVALTAILQMFTIERAFNEIWRVHQARPIARRAAVHVLALVLGPLIFGGSLVATTFLVTKSLGLAREPAWVTLLVNEGTSFVLVGGLFALLYWAVPNRKVAWRHAWVGGAIAALGFSGLQALFSNYVVKLGSYTVLFGTFSAIPVFLSWVYASWGIVLIGALLVAELPRRHAG